jgi:hypothetical protein
MCERDRLYVMMMMMMMMMMTLVLVIDFRALLVGSGSGAKCGIPDCQSPSFTFCNVRVLYCLVAPI